LNSNNKFFVFVKTPSKVYSSSTIVKNSSFSSIFSITELFFAANWLEREVSELNGIFFTGKKDIRNLMLQYGDSSSPFQKSFPTIGLKEMYYNPIKDTIVQNPVTLQI
jgi:NADH:ubiquinone oxidoreductase subunit C